MIMSSTESIQQWKPKNKEKKLKIRKGNIWRLVLPGRSEYSF
jgi:hypothetical protein